MTDNEKRAHDLAVALLPVELQIANRQYHEGKVESIDLYAIYLQRYNQLLDNINADFPQ